MLTSVRIVMVRYVPFYSSNSMTNAGKTLPPLSLFWPSNDGLLCAGWGCVSRIFSDAAAAQPEPSHTPRSGWHVAHMTQERQPTRRPRLTQDKSGLLESGRGREAGASDHSHQHRVTVAAALPHLLTTDYYQKLPGYHMTTLARAEGSRPHLATIR